MPAGDMALFVRVAELGSFAAVALEIGQTPSGVSKALTRLEDRLGVKLLHRTTRKLVLTQEGETYLSHARPILAAIEAADAEVAGQGGVPQGLLRINTGTAFAKHRLAALLPGFQKAYPRITLSLSVNDHRIDPFADQIDVTIRVGALSDSDLIAHPLGSVHRIIAASPDYLARFGTPEQPGDLRAHNCLRLKAASAQTLWPMIENGQAIAYPISGTIECDSADLLLDFALAGLGIIRLGDFLGEKALADGRLIPLLAAYHNPTPAPITALILPGRQKLPRVRAFIDYLARATRSAHAFNPAPLIPPPAPL